MLCASYHVRNQSLIYAVPFLVMQSNLAASFKTKIKLFIVSLAVLVFYFNNQTTTLWNSSNTTDQGEEWGGGGGELLPIHSLKLNLNDVLTTCKAISKVLASGFVY